jgi:hypothetical protein
MLVECGLDAGGLGGAGMGEWENTGMGWVDAGAVMGDRMRTECVLVCG